MPACSSSLQTCDAVAPGVTVMEAVTTLWTVGEGVGPSVGTGVGAFVGAVVGAFVGTGVGVAGFVGSGVVSTGVGVGTPGVGVETPGVGTAFVGSGVVSPGPGVTLSVGVGVFSAFCTGVGVVEGLGCGVPEFFFIPVSVFV